MCIAHSQYSAFLSFLVSVLHVPFFLHTANNNCSRHRLMEYFEKYLCFLINQLLKCFTGRLDNIFIILLLQKCISVQLFLVTIECRKQFHCFSSYSFLSKLSNKYGCIHHLISSFTVICKWAFTIPMFAETIFL